MHRPFSERLGGVMMFGSGFFLLLGSASVGVVYGMQETLSVLISRVAPRLLGAVHSFFSRIGVGEVWRDYMAPFFELPAWMVFAAIGSLLLAIGILRRI